MKVHYYPETDSLYIDLLDKPSVEAQEVRPGIVLDFDEDGRFVGIDIDQASKNAELASLDFEALPLQPAGSAKP